MKLFLIYDGFCYNDLTRLYKNLEEAKSHYSASTLIVEAPDYVFEGWMYDSHLSGDERFVKPETPEGWLYDENTGTYYQELTNSEKRKMCYESGYVLNERKDFTIKYEDSLYTLDSLASLGMKYEFRGNIEKANEIRNLVKETFDKIQATYPD